MYPTNLDAMNLEVINFIDIISNIKNMDFQQSPLPPIFRTFNATDTKTSKGSSNNEHSDQPPRKIPKKKGSKVQNESTLSKWRFHNVQNHPQPNFLKWEMKGFCFSDCLHKAYHMNSHAQDRKEAITKNIMKLISGQK